MLWYVPFKLDYVCDENEPQLIVPLYVNFHLLRTKAWPQDIIREITQKEICPSSQFHHYRNYPSLTNQIKPNQPIGKIIFRNALITTYFSAYDKNLKP